MKKKSAHKLVHAAFPQQGAPQPAHMGSQSQAPTANIDMQNTGPQAPGLPVDSATSMSPGGEY